MIQERFDELHPYLKGVKISDEFVIVESMIKSTWKIDEILPEDVQIQTKDEKRTDSLRYHMFYSKERSIDSLIDLLEMIINVNIELEQKQELLKSKVEELKKMFQDKPLDELMLLKFTSEIDVNLKVTKPEPPKSQIIREGEDPKLRENVSTEEV